jgi:hypothetical protein
MHEKFPFITDQRPWEQAFVIVAGASDVAHDPYTEVVLAPAPDTARTTGGLRA